MFEKKVSRAEKLSAPFVHAFRDATRAALPLLQELASRAQRDNSELMRAFKLIERLSQAALDPAVFAQRYLAKIAPATVAAVQNDPDRWLRNQLRTLQKGLGEEG